MTTKLDAINEMLEGIGEYTILELETGEETPAGQAERVFDRENRRVQLKGWMENTEAGVVLSPTDGQISLGDDVLALEADGVSEGRQLAIRDGKLWDCDKNTATFASSVTVTVKIIRLLDFEKLSPTLQEAISARAKMVYQRQAVADPQLDEYFSDEATAANEQAKRANANGESANILNTDFARRIAGRSGMNFLQR